MWSFKMSTTKSLAVKSMAHLEVSVLEPRIFKPEMSSLLRLDVEGELAGQVFRILLMEISQP